MSVLPLSAANELAVGLVQTIAEERDARVIFIKGLVTERYRQRVSRPSSDVDVLVESGSFESVVTGLCSLGWHLRPQSMGHAAFVDHSVSLMHDRWPNDIDVHVYFPGFFNSSELVFEELWRERATVQLASHDVDVAGEVASFIIVVLHALRSPYEPASQQQLDFAENYVKERGGSFLAAMEDVVKRTGASIAMAPFLRRLGIEPGDPGAPSIQSAIWALHAEQGSRAADWGVLALLTPGVIPKLRLVRAALMPSVTDLKAERPWLESSTFTQRMVARGTRLRVGARAVVQALPYLMGVVRLVAGRRDIRRPAPQEPLGISATPLAARVEQVASVAVAAPARTPAETSASVEAVAQPSPRTGVRFGHNPRALVAFTESPAHAYGVSPSADRSLQVLDFNETACVLWELLGTPMTRDELVEKAAEVFDSVPRDELSTHIAGWLESMLAAQLLVTH